MTNSPFNISRKQALLAATALAGIAVLFSAPVEAKSKPANDPTMSGDVSSLRLELDKVDLAIESGKTNEAYDMIEKLKEKYPGNADVIAMERDLTEMRAESKSTIFSELCAPNSLDPNSMNLLWHERNAGNRGGFVCGAYNRRLTPQSVEQITSLTGSVAVPYPGVSVNFDLENNHLNTYAPFNRANGTEQSFYGNRQQGSVMLQKTFQNRDQAGITVYGNDQTAGAGLQYMLSDRWGGTALQVNYNQPDWDYIEMVVQGGTKSNVRLERKQIISPAFQAVLGVGYTHYALMNYWDAAEAPGWNFALDYNHVFRLFDQHTNNEGWMNDQFTLGAHYGVDAEYFTHVGRRTDRTGDTFNAIPATTYEVHSFVVSLAKTILPQVDAEIDGGYGVNRIDGSNGPIYGGSITYTPIKHLGIDIHGSRTMLGGQNNGQKENIVGASLKWLW